MQNVRYMFDYYKIRFRELKADSAELGYELTAPIGVIGVVIFFVMLYLTSDEFGFYMWRADITLPAAVVLGTVAILSLIAFISDELGPRSIVALLVVAAVFLAAVAPASFALHV